MVRVIFFIAVLTSLFFQGCTKVSEPWVEKDRLLQERSRSEKQVMTLQHRIMMVQADR